jgi:hypothetical protein
MEWTITASGSPRAGAGLNDIAVNLHEKVHAYVNRHFARLPLEEILDIHSARDSALASLNQARVSERKVTITISGSERSFTTTVEYGAYRLVTVDELLAV